SSGGGCPGSNFRGTTSPSGSQAPSGVPHIDPQKLPQYLGLILVAAIALFILYFMFLYLSSVFRFVLYESVVRKRCEIGESWDRWHAAGRRYFLWQIVFLISTGLFFLLMVALPLGFAAALGWLAHPKSHVVGLVLGGLFLFFCFLVFLLVVGVVHVLAKDFLVPVIALENLDFAEGWRRVFEIASPEKGPYAVYILL